MPLYAAPDGQRPIDELIRGNLGRMQLGPSLAGLGLLPWSGIPLDRRADFALADGRMMHHP